MTPEDRWVWMNTMRANCEARMRPAQTAPDVTSPSVDLRDLDPTPSEAVDISGRADAL